MSDRTTESITDEDVQLLLARNPVASEQLRAIIHERQAAEWKRLYEEATNGVDDS